MDPERAEVAAPACATAEVAARVTAAMWVPAMAAAATTATTAVTV